MLIGNARESRYLLHQTTSPHHVEERPCGLSAAPRSGPRPVSRARLYVLDTVETFGTAGLLNPAVQEAVRRIGAATGDAITGGGSEDGADYLRRCCPRIKLQVLGSGSYYMG